jgi:hypothetical protein
LAAFQKFGLCLIASVIEAVREILLGIAIGFCRIGALPLILCRDDRLILHYGICNTANRTEGPVR